LNTVLCHFCRELYPALLKRGDRGKHHNPNAVPAEYGQTRVAEGVEGAELLEAYENGEIEINSDGTCPVYVWTGQRHMCFVASSAHEAVAAANICGLADTIVWLEYMPNVSVLLRVQRCKY
jgi:hypothetical protein